MTFQYRAIAAAIAGVLVVGVGVVLLGGSGGKGVGSGQSPQPSATPSATPGATASATPTPASTDGPTNLVDGPLPPGTYVATPFAPGVLGEPWSCLVPPQPGCSVSEDDSIRVTLTVPELGWSGINQGVWLTDRGNGPPDGAALGFSRGGWLFSDPCAPDGGPGPDIEVGPTADDLANALAAHPLLDATDPVPVTLGGFTGKYVVIQVPDPLTGCPGGSSYYPWFPGIYAQGPGHRWRSWILDVDGVRVVALAMDYAGTSAEHRAALDSMVESIQIEN